MSKSSTEKLEEQKSGEDRGSKWGTGRPHFEDLVWSGLTPNSNQVLVQFPLFIKTFTIHPRIWSNISKYSGPSESLIYLLSRIQRCDLQRVCYSLSSYRHLFLIFFLLVKYTNIIFADGLKFGILNWRISLEWQPHQWTPNKNWLCYRIYDNDKYWKCTCSIMSEMWNISRKGTSIVSKILIIKTKT